MRKKLFAGNWKMNLTQTEGRALIAELRADLDRDAAFATGAPFISDGGWTVT
jgi:triosephosphate isomerase